ncbi:MAG: hypothetical protein ABIY90_16930 [Puia sp.]
MPPWFSLVEHSFIRRFIPHMFRSANTEKIHYRMELVQMLPLWKQIRENRSHFIARTKRKAIRQNILDVQNIIKTHATRF